MNSLVDSNYYTNIYGGTAVPSNAITRLCLEATYYVNDICQGRLKDNANVTDDVKLAICAVMDKMYSVECDGGIKQSETTGRYSVTYASENESREKAYYKAALIYLADTGLLYRGVR